VPLLNAATRPPDEAEVLLTVISPVNAEVFAFPLASVSEPDATVTTAVPPTDDDAVNVALYDVLLADWKLLSVPSVALTSARTKFDVASEMVNVTVDVPPEFTELGFALTVTVGTTPSITIAFAPPILLEPLGTVVEVIALPAVSRTVPMVNEDTVRSEVELPEATVYVPVNVVPADAAVSVTEVPVFSVIEMVLPN